MYDIYIYMFVYTCTVYIYIIYMICIYILYLSYIYIYIHIICTYDKKTETSMQFAMVLCHLPITVIYHHLPDLTSES